jgi:hypothetical protein
MPHNTGQGRNNDHPCQCREILYAAHVGVLRALEVAGKRLITKDRHHRGRYQDVPPHLRHVRKHAPGVPDNIPIGVPVRDEDLDRLLRGVWDLLAEAIPGRPDVVTVADTYVRQLLVTGEPHQLRYLEWAFDRAGLTSAIVEEAR